MLAERLTTTPGRPNPKALAHAIVGGARARQAPLEAELEGAPSFPPHQAAALRVGANATSSKSKTARSACVPAAQATQTTQCSRSWSGPRFGAPPSPLQSSAGTKTEIAAEAPNIALWPFGEGAKARVLKDEGANNRRKSDSPRQPPLFPRNIHHRSRLACRQVFLCIHVSRFYWMLGADI